MPALMQATRTVPIVFVQVPDPVGSGFVASLARPGGNATGFTQFDFSLSGKWLEVLKEIAPRVAHVAVLRDPVDPAGTGQFGAIQIAAPPLGIEVRPVDVREPNEIENGIAALANTTDGGLIITGSAPSAVHRDLIIKLAAQYRLPAVYPYRFYATDGGLVSYGPIPLTLIGRRRAMWTAFLRERSQRTCRFKRQRDTNSSSIAKLQSPLV